jgi:hypothetical protein
MMGGICPSDGRPCDKVPCPLHCSPTSVVRKPNQQGADLHSGMDRTEVKLRVAAAHLRNMSAVLEDADRIVSGLHSENEYLRAEAKRLQDLLDRRPANNEHLPTTYGKWNGEVYASDAKASLPTSGSGAGK